MCSSFLVVDNNIAVYFHLVVDNSSISVLINSFGDNIAGEAYHLECSASKFGISDQIIITWLDSRNIEVHPGMVAINNGTAVLRFNPLMSSDAGTYTCKVASGNAVQSKSVNVTVESKYINATCNTLIFHTLIF